MFSLIHRSEHQMHECVCTCITSTMNIFSAPRSKFMHLSLLLRQRDFWEVHMPFCPYSTMKTSASVPAAKMSLVKTLISYGTSGTWQFRSLRRDFTVLVLSLTHVPVVMVFCKVWYTQMSAIKVHICACSLSFFLFFCMGSCLILRLKKNKKRLNITEDNEKMQIIKYNFILTMYLPITMIRLIKMIIKRDCQVITRFYPFETSPNPHM